MTTNDQISELKELLERTAAGDEIAFAELYKRTSAKLFGVALRICGNREIAQEALQDSYVKIWNNAGNYNPSIASPIAWMATIARNRSIDLKRSQAERVSAGASPVDDNMVSGAEDPLAATELSEELRDLMRCLGQLPEDRREMVLLAYCAGWSRDELAARFARPVATVKTLLRRSLALLRGCLDER